MKTTRFRDMPEYKAQMQKLKQLGARVKQEKRKAGIGGGSKDTNTLDGYYGKLRDVRITETVNDLKKNINSPITAETCSGTSFCCDVEGSGKTPIVNVNTMPCDYDYLGTPMKDGSLCGSPTFELPILHNWQNSSNETKYTKSSLRDTIGFENFQ